MVKLIHEGYLENWQTSCANVKPSRTQPNSGLVSPESSVPDSTHSLFRSALNPAKSSHLPVLEMDITGLFAIFFNKSS